MRDYRFDVARVLCMSFIVVFVHLWAYIHPEVTSAIYVHPVFDILTNSCLGLFTFASGYLLGGKYSFGKDGNTKIWPFYKKRILRIIPLFLLAALVLYLIGFNNARATLNGALCISPFIKPRPMTLWYIPVIMCCYLITPLVCRKSFYWRLGSAVILFVVMVLLWKLYPSIDLRLLFNLVFYLIGLVTAPYFDWSFKRFPFLKWITITVFIVLLVITHFRELGELVKLGFSGIGVFALLFVSEYLAKLVYNKDNILTKLIAYVSYASMTCYMFHRLFFWSGEFLWNPSNPSVKWLYMAGIVYPVMIVLSYYIQRGYDLLANGLKKRKV